MCRVIPLDSNSPQIAWKELLFGRPPHHFSFGRAWELDILSQLPGLTKATDPVPLRDFPKRRLQALEMKSSQAVVALDHHRSAFPEAYPALLHLRLIIIRFRPLPPLQVHVISHLEHDPVEHYLLVENSPFGGPRGGSRPPLLLRVRGDGRQTRNVSLLGGPRGGSRPPLLLLVRGDNRSIWVQQRPLRNWFGSATGNGRWNDRGGMVRGGRGRGTERAPGRRGGLWRQRNRRRRVWEPGQALRRHQLKPFFLDESAARDLRTVWRLIFWSRFRIKAVKRFFSTDRICSNFLIPLISINK